MPDIYEVELDDGRIVEIESYGEPTESEIFAALDAHRTDQRASIREELGFTPEGEIKPFLEGGTGTQIGIGGQQILPSIGKMGWGALEGAQDLMSKSFPFRQVTEPLRRSLMGEGDPVKDFLGRRRQSKSEDVQALETIGQATEGPSLARHVTATAGSLAPSVAVAPLGFGAMVASAGLQSYGAAFAEAKERGLSDNQAQLDGLVKGVITSIVTGGFGKTGIEILSRPSVRQPITKAVSKILFNVGFEATEEVADEMLQLVYDIAVRGEPLEGAAYRALVAAVAGGLFGGGAATVQVISAARETMEAPRTPQDKLSQVGATRTAEAIAKPVQRTTEPGEVALSKVTMEGGAFNAEGKPLPQDTPAAQPEATTPETPPTEVRGAEVQTGTMEALRSEGITPENAEALMRGTKTVQEVVDEQLGVFRPTTGGGGMDAETIIVEERPDGGRDIGFSPEAGPAATMPRDAGQMSHSDAVELARQSAVEKVQEILSRSQSTEAVPPPIPQTEPQADASEGVTPEQPAAGRSVGIAISGPKWGRFFRAEGGLPVATFQSWVERTGKIKAMTRDITYATRDLYRALREAYGISRWRQIVSGFKSIPKADVEMLNEALADPNFDMSQIDERLHAPLNRMRQHVDALSQHMVEQGLVDEELAATIEGNLGTYLARSYRIFDEADWVDRIPGEVFEAARNKVLGGMIAENRAQNKKIRARNKRKKTDDPESPDPTPEDASRALRNMLEDWRQAGQIPGATTRRGGKLGAKDLSLFLQRKDISQEIRAVMGEYKNPVINFARTISKMARFIADQEFLGQVRAQGMGVFLFDPADAPAGFNTEIAAEGSSAMSPLNGLRTSREIAQAFNEFSKQGQVMEGWRLYFQLNAISKAAKTIGSLMTQQRNLMGQPFFWAASGHYDMRQIGKAFQAAMADMGLNNADKWRKYYKKMVRLGLAEDTARAEELREVMRDAKLDEVDPDQFAGKALGQFLRQAFIKVPIRIYQLSDEFGKMVGFENEKARLSRIHKDWNEDALETEAARRTRLTYPTYSMAPDWIRKLRRVILFGPYITFPYEVFRTTFHNIRIGLSDISQANNPQSRRAGAERLAGTMLVTGSIGYGLQLMSQAIWDIADDEVEDLRRFLPEWSKNAQFVFLGKGKDGTLSYLNFSYLNPYNYLSDAVVAGLRGENVLESVLNGFKEFASPFTNEQMLSARVVDALRNKTQNGREIYNEQDDDDTKFLKIMSHILEALEPGTSQRLRERIIPSYRDRQPDVSGRQLDPVIETTSELSGLRMEKFDFVEGLKWNTRRFTKSEDNAESIFHQAAFRAGKSDTNALVDAYVDSDAKRFELWRDMRRDIDAAMRRGISEKDIKNMLKAERVPAYKVRALMDKRYVPLAVSDSARRRARERQSEAALESIKAYQKSKDGIPLE